MVGALTAGLLIGLSAAVLSGTAAMLVMETAQRSGMRVASAAGAGIATGDGVWAAVAVAAGATLNRMMTSWATVLQWTGVAIVAVLFVLAVRELIGFDPVAAQGTRLPVSPMRAYVRFFAGTLVDPVTVVFFLSLIIGAAPSYRGGEAAVFAGGAFLASLSWQWGAAVLGRRRGPLTARARRAVLSVDAVLLALFIGYIALGLYRS